MTDTRTKEKLSCRQRRMRTIVHRMQVYVTTYSEQVGFDTYSDKTFIEDMVYGIGKALAPLTYHAAPGYDEFKARLKKELK